MSTFDYLGADGYFTPHGKIVKTVNSERSRTITTIPESLDEIADEFEAGNSDNRRECTKLLAENTLRSQTDTLQAIKRLADVSELKLLDKGTGLNRLAIDEPAIEKALYQLIEQMHADNDDEDVKASVYTIGSVTAGANNVGTGGLVASKVLDGVSQPCQRVRAHPRYLNVDSELMCVETVTVVCVVDSQGSVSPMVKSSNGFSSMLQPNFLEDREVWYVYGYSPTGNRVSSQNNKWGSGYGIDAEGSGPGPFLHSVDYSIGTSDTITLANTGFEFWAVTDEPDEWGDDSAGAASTNVFNSTAVAFRGSSSLNFRGSAAVTTIRRSQLLSEALPYLVGSKRYYVSLWAKVDSVPAAGDFLVQFTGTSYTAGSTEKISVAAAALSTSWTHYGFFVTLPTPVPSDWQLELEWNGTPTTGRNLYIDEVKFRAIDWHGGFGLTLYNGDVLPVVGDTFSFPITQSVTGIFQEFNRRWWGVQMPSKTDNSESIGDGLAI